MYAIRPQGHHTSAALGPLSEVVSVVLGRQLLFVVGLSRMCRDYDPALKVVLTQPERGEEERKLLGHIWAFLSGGHHHLDSIGA